MFYLSLSLLFVICNVRSQSTCDINITDLKRNKVDIGSYCTSEIPCIVKCCAEDEVIYSKKKINHCKNIEDVKKELNNNLTHINFDYSDLKIFKNDIYKVQGGEISTKKYKDFVVLHSDTYMGRMGDDHDNKCSLWTKSVKILEKGTLVIPQPNHYEYWTPRDTPLYCVDMAVGMRGNEPKSTFFYKLYINDRQNLAVKNLFTAIALLISAFFLLLVLLVYSILHELRNIQGMLLCAYVATLMVMYILKAFSLLYKDGCVLVTQLIYFLILASFFWLKLMSFDIWWTFRGTRKLRDIHRRGINVKMMIYASYAYGASAAMTIFAVIMDKQNFPQHIAKPLFAECFGTDTFFLYLYIPLMILTVCNCLLFMMTMYNIWLIRQNMATFDKAAVKKNNNNQNRFMLYIKLSMLMGVSWILELVQMRLSDEVVPVWLYILINSYNVFIGVIIFFLFVFKTKIFLMLCKRFKIEKWAHRNLKITSSTRTDMSKGSKSYSRNYSRTRSTSDSDGEDGIVIKSLELGNGKGDPNSDGEDGIVIKSLELGNGKGDPNSDGEDGIVIKSLELGNGKGDPNSDGEDGIVIKSLELGNGKGDPNSDGEDGIVIKSLELGNGKGDPNSKSIGLLGRN